MLSATPPDPLALDLWTPPPPPRTTTMVRLIPEDHSQKAGVAAVGLPAQPTLETVEEYVRGLEKERSKVEAFRRELPICMLILTHVIEGLKVELQARRGNDQMLQTKNRPAGNPSWMIASDHDGAASNNNNNNGSGADVNAGSSDVEGSAKGCSVAGVTGTGRDLPSQQAPRKARRCWSTELHQRFVSAIDQLGGYQVATPKQIRRLMKVDGLTNDEVKSHLQQKYRLHRQRSPGSSSSPPAAEQAPPTVTFWDRGTVITWREKGSPAAAGRGAAAENQSLMITWPPALGTDQPQISLTRKPRRDHILPTMNTHTYT